MILAFILHNTVSDLYIVKIGPGGTITTSELNESKLFYLKATAVAAANYLQNNWAVEEYWLMTLPAPKRMDGWNEELMEQKKQTHPDTSIPLSMTGGHDGC